MTYQDLQDFTTLLAYGQRVNGGNTYDVSLHQADNGAFLLCSVKRHTRRFTYTLEKINRETAQKEYAALIDKRQCFPVAA